MLAPIDEIWVQGAKTKISNYQYFSLQRIRSVIQGIQVGSHPVFSLPWPLFELFFVHCLDVLSISFLQENWSIFFEIGQSLIALLAPSCLFVLH